MQNSDQTIVQLSLPAALVEEARAIAQEQNSTLEEVLAERLMTNRPNSAALRESEERYRIATELSHTVALAMSVDEAGLARVDWVAGAMQQTTGYTLEEIRSGQGMLTLVGPSELGRINAALQRMIGSGQPETLEFQLIDRAGQVHHVRGTTRVEWDAARGRAGRIFAVIQDITAQVEAEMALRESEKRYRIVSQLTSDYAFAMRFARDGHLEVEWITEAVRRFPGTTPDELSGRDDLLERFHPDDLPRVMEALSPERAGDAVRHLTLRYISRRGIERDLAVDFLIETNEEDPRILHVYGAAHDITEQLAAERLEKRRAELNRILNRISRTFIDQDLDTAINFMLFSLADYVGEGADRVWLIRQTGDADHLQVTNHWSREGVQTDLAAWQDLRWEELPWLHEQARKGHPFAYRVDEIPATETIVRQVAARNNTRHVLTIPLMEGGQPIGLLGFDSTTHDEPWQGTEVMLLRLAGELVVMALKRHRTEAELRQREEMFRLLAENASDLIVLNDAMGKAMYVSPSIERLLGFSPAERLGMSVIDLLHPADVDEVARTILRAHKQHEADTRFEYRIRTKGGVYIWFETQAQRVYDSRGQLQHYVTVSRDISERKQGEVNIRRHAAALRTLQSISVTISTTLELAVVLSRMVDAAVDLFDASYGAAFLLYDAEQDDFRFVRAVGRIADFQDRRKSRHKGVTGLAYRTRQVQIINDYNNWKGHLPEWVAEPNIAVMETPVIWEDQVLGMLTVVADNRLRTFGENDRQLAAMLSAQGAVAMQNARLVEALRSSELRFRSLVEHSTDGIRMINATGTVSLWNRGMERITGLSEAGALGRKAWEVQYQLLPEERRASLSLEALREQVQDVLRTGEIKNDAHHNEYQLQRTDGSRRVVLSSSFPIPTDKGYMFGGIIRDITEHKAAEQRELELKLERRRVEILRDFIADASHDLRTPLSAMQNTLYVLRMLTQEIDGAGEHIDRLERQANRLNTMLHDMLRLAELDADDLLAMGPVDVNELLRYVVAEQQPLAEEKGHHLAFLPADELPLIQGEEQHLFRAFSNILVNALLYTPPGGIVRVLTEQSDAQVLVTVSDTGVGIPPDKLPHIFRRFYRGDEARTGNTGGSGLGLAIAAKVAERHQGEIHVESTPGEGTTIRVRLPIQPGDPSTTSGP
jgi:PAS domain S-box-containing protein